jgi:hypothetical protein
MKRRRPPVTVKGRTIPAIVLAFAAGGLAGFWLHVAMSSRVVAAPMVAAPMMVPAAPAVAANDAPAPAVRIPNAAATIGVDPVADLRRRKLRDRKPNQCANHPHTPWSPHTPRNSAIGNSHGLKV